MADDLKDLREQFQADVDELTEARDERAKDLRYLAGDPWDPKDKDARIKAGRPYLAFDELNQYVNQVVNDLRANPRAVAFAPAADSGQDGKIAEKRAQLYADKMREIEYRSNAKLAYTLAAENAIQGGYGYVRVTSKYAPKSVSNQELWVEPVPDPDCVVLDPFHQRPDGSDATRCFVLEKRRIAEFRQQFPKAKVQSFEAYPKDDPTYATWIQPDRILLAESWKVLTKKRPVVMVELPPVEPVKEIAAAEAAAARGRRHMFDADAGRFVDAAVHARSDLVPGAGVTGPAIIVERETATVVTSAFKAVVQPDGCLLVARI